MAERRPLVQINGRLKELPVGDTLPGAAGACEVLVADGVSAPPVMLTNESQDDFLYSD